MKKILITCLSILALNLVALAQTTKITTAGKTGYAGDIWIGPGSTITFAIANNNSHSIILTQMEGFKSTAGPGFPLNPASFKLWYSATSLSGSAGLVDTPVWTRIGSDVANMVNMVPGYNIIFSGINFPIPANTTYRFALESSTGTAYSGTSSPNILTADSVSLIVGSANNVGYAGSYPNSSYNDSYFTGSITFKSALPCTSPPNAGVTVSSVADTCSGLLFNLDLSGYSVGIGQTFQWQSSSNNSTWNNLLNDTLSALTISQAVSTYYRCGLTCATNTSYSTPVQVTTPASVSGNYTINSTQATGGINFQSFTDAINYVSCGINGPVVFNVVAGTGPYTEQISIPFIGGTTSTNTIRFNGHGETLLFNGASNDNKAILTLNDADHIIIDSLVIDGSAGANCWGILFTNKADSNTIKNCTINTGIISVSQVAYFGIIFNGSSQTTSVSGNNGNYNLIIGNTINGGNNGIYLWGAGALANENIENKIVNNRIKDFYSYGVSANYMPLGTVVSGNDFSRPTTTSTASQTGGVLINIGCSSALVEKNKVHNMFDAMAISTATCYGINISGSATATKENKIINNLVYGMISSGNTYGIYNNGASNMQAYHNSIILDDINASLGASYGLAQNGAATGIVFKNNLVAITKGGTGVQRCINYNNISSSIISNHNALYINCPGSSAANIGLYGTATYATLVDWKGANSNAYDQQSVSTDPLFLNAGTFNYTPSAPVINDVGENVGIATDILGNTRNIINPDPGAYEFTVVGCSNPPTAGTASATVANTCPSIAFGLQLSGNSFGAGQIYQWQSSPNNSTWANIGTALTAPSFSVSQASSNYYRCAVQCSGGTIVYSSSVQVITPSYLSGTFTINSAVSTGGSNFQSFNDALNAIKCGINGPVVFNIAAGSGPYSEHFTIPEITGSSTANSLTINGNGATLLYTSNDASNKTAIILNGADHVIIDSLTIDVSSGSFGYGIVLTNQADSNIIRKCTILCSRTISTQNAVGIQINGSATSFAASGNNGNYNSIFNNTIIGGYYSINLYGNSSSSAQNISNNISNNILKDMYSYAIYATYQSVGLVISGNNILRPARTNTTTTGGAYIYTGCAGSLIEKNKVHNMFDAMPTITQISYGFFMGADAPVGQPNKVINNLVYNMNGNGAVYGIMCTFGSNCKMYHNTIVLDDQTATSGAAYGVHNPMPLTGLDFKNNIVYISRSGTGLKTCVSIGISASGFASNNNIFYSTGNIGTLQGTNYASFATWKTANSNAYDQASVNADPLFANTTAANYKPTASIVDNIGTGLGVLTDIVGVVRSTGLPDAGAYEFLTILPLKVMSYELRIVSENKVESKWVSANEINVSHFNIQRSLDGQEFKTIGKIAAKNKSSNEYQFIDNLATNYSLPTTLFYRLQGIDNDGKINYSETKSLTTHNSQLTTISIYPNPVANDLNVAIISPTIIKASFIIADIYGKIIFTKDINLAVGDNVSTINVASLAAGNYTLKLVCKNGCETATKKFVKQ